MATIRHQSSLTDQLDALASALEGLDLETDMIAAGFSNRRDRLVRSIRRYSIPRLSEEPGPLLVVFAGPTGSGKSTLVNSISGLEFSETGPLRPTTTGPVVLTASPYVSSFQEISGVDCEVIGGGAPILTTIALVDTPDLDSTSTHNRAKAEILIDNADIVVFVTSALRYADLVPWEVLRRAGSRGAPVINVINRLGAGSGGAVTDFRARLKREGLDADVVRVPEHHISAGSHRLPGLAVRELQRRILDKATELSDDRREVVDRVVRSTASQVLDLAGDLESLIKTFDGGRGEIRQELEGAARELDLTSLCVGLLPTDRPTGSLSRLIWIWRNHLGADEWAAMSATIEQRLVSIVETDMRQIAAGRDEAFWLSREDIEELRERTSLLARDWLTQLESLTSSRRRMGGQLATLVLADAAVIGRRTPLFDRFFEDGSLVVRANRGLIGPLEAVYSTIGSHLTDRDPVRLSKDDAERLRELAATVSARSHFADA